MGDKSKIEWTDATWNPVTGCNKVSPGCKHCYAETFAERWRGIPGHAYEQGFDLKLWPARLEVPLRWKRPRMIFVNSMSDLFHDKIPDEFIDRVFAVMALSPQHTFQVLTKRADRMREYTSSLTPERLELAAHGLPALTFNDLRNHRYPFRNVWLGVSIESDAYVSRADELREAPAAVRFLSIEPLLAPVPSLCLDGIHWVIVGGESGPNARPMRAPWVTDVRDRCIEAKVPFFFKQWGGVRKKETGRLLDGRVWNQMPGGER